MSEQITITGGPMELVLWAPGSTGGNYSLQGINGILGGQSWILELDPTGGTCVGLLPAGAPVPTGPGTTFCHVSALESLRPYGAPCSGCFQVDTWENGQYIRDNGHFTGGHLIKSQTVSYGELGDFHYSNPLQTAVPEPPVAGLLILAVVILAGRHAMSLLTRRPRRAIIEAQ